MKELYFVPLPPSLFDNLKRALGDDITKNNLISAYIGNMQSLLDAVSLPYRLAEQFASFRARSLIAIKETILHAELTQNQLDEISNAKFTESLDNQDEANRIFNDIAIPLLQMSTEQRKSSIELINQGILLTWSALEVFFRDYIELYINSDPSCCKNIIDNEILKKRNDLRKLSFEYLMESRFDISKRLGTIIVESYDCSDLVLIKEILRCIIPDPSVDEVLNRKELWILFQTRHLLVHRRGIVDKAYIEKTGMDLNIGDKILFRPTDLERYIVLSEEVVRLLVSTR